MTRSLLLRVALVVMLILALAGCGGSGSDDRTPRALELAAGAASRSSVPVAAGRGPLAPGIYYTALLQPPLTFQVGEGWTVETSSSGQLNVTRSAPYADLVLLQPDLAHAVVREPPIFNTLVVEDPFHGSADPQPFPEDYLAWLAGSPYLDVAVPERDDELGGFEGSSIEVTVANTPADGECFGAPGNCFSAYEIEGTTIGIGYASGERFRAWQLDGPNGRLIAFGQPVGPGALAANDVVASIERL